MGRIKRRRESAQEDSENSLYGKLEAKRKQKSFKLKGVTKENKSPALGRSTVVKTTKRMALVDKTNKSSPSRNSKLSKDVPLMLADASIKKSAISANVVITPVKDAKHDAVVTCTNENGKNLESLKENRVPRYRVSPIERPVTRSRKHVQTGGKGTSSKGTGAKQKKGVKREGDDDEENQKATTGAEIQELMTEVTTSVNDTHKPATIRTRKCPILVEKVGLSNSTSPTKGNDKPTDSFLKAKAADKDVDLPSTFKGRPVRKRKQADIRKEEEAVGVEEKVVPTIAGPVEKSMTGVCAYCRGVESTCTCHKVTETPLSSTKTSSPGKLNDARSELKKISEVSKKKDSPPLEPIPSCSRSSGEGTPFRKPRTPKLSSESRKSLPKVPCPSIFSIFKKPDTPRRNSNENKIFVSGSKQTSSTNLRSARNPVYANKNMTPLRRRDSPAPEQKERLYEFEVDESEPKPKKKQRPIMKIQRVRPYKKKTPKVYVPDPEMEMRLLRNLDLSPSVLGKIKAKKMEEVKIPTASNQPSMPAQGVETPACVSDHKTQTDGSAEDRQAPSSDGGIYDVYMDDDHHGDSEIDPCPSSPCSKYGSSTPMQSGLNKSRDSLLDESIHRFGGLSAKLYSPVKSQASPMPVLLENYNNDPVRNGDSDRSVASNVSVVSGNSTYVQDLDISASTPVKFHKHDSTAFVSKRLEPAELNVSNCFGFDEPEAVEEPLVSPIKTAIYIPRPPASPARAAPIIKKKLLVQPPTHSAPVDVDEVIKQLRFEVGENSSASNSLANLSVFEDTEFSPKKRSPMKRYLQSKADVVPENVDDDSVLDFEATAAKIPRLSYERPKLRKRVVIAEQSVLDKSDRSEFPDNKLSDSEDDEGKPAEIPFEIRAHKFAKKPKSTPKKARREEEELEKWAKMFNSQCEQVEGFGLCVE